MKGWKGGSFQSIVLRNIDIEFDGHNDSALKNIVAAQPHVDSRVLPCWGMFVRNVKELVLDNIKLSYTGSEVRTAFYLDNVANIDLDNVRCRKTANLR